MGVLHILLISGRNKPNHHAMTEQGRAKIKVAHPRLHPHPHLHLHLHPHPHVHPTPSPPPHNYTHTHTHLGLGGEAHALLPPRENQASFGHTTGSSEACVIPPSGPPTPQLGAVASLLLTRLPVSPDCMVRVRVCVCVYACDCVCVCVCDCVCDCVCM
jgi:hypothetical protein